MLQPRASRGTWTCLGVMEHRGFASVLIGSMEGRNMATCVRLGATAAGLTLALGAIPLAKAALTEAQFPPKTVQDLIAICSPARDDPMMTASINYCHGYAEGAVIVEMAHARQPHGRKLFCLPDPPPSSGTELGNFISWANEDPSRLQQPAVDGMFLYLAQKYPCSGLDSRTGRR
jgi:Ssp1 endopeptidase immunity protein Rap1a